MPSRPAPSPSRPTAWYVRGAWLVVLVAALAFTAAVNRARWARVDYVTQQPHWSGPSPELAASSATGYAGGVRNLIAPYRRSTDAFLVIETQQLEARRQWRLEQVDYDNAPRGRAAEAQTLYRWWLLAAGAVDRLFSVRSAPLAIEHASVYANAALQFALLLLAPVLVARRFGGLAAGGVALALAAWFPFATLSQVGTTDPLLLACVLALASLLSLVAAASRTPAPGASRRQGALALAFSGAVGGAAVWANPGAALPLMGGTVLGGLWQAALARRSSADAPTLPWRAWGAAGAITVLLACSIDGWASHPEWPGHGLHPLHAIAWLGSGEVLAFVTAWTRRATPAGSRVLITRAALGLLAVIAWPIASRLGAQADARSMDLLASELTVLPGAIRARNLFAWIRDAGPTLALWATLVPALVIGTGIVVTVRRRGSEPLRSGVAIALGPVLVTLVIACGQLRAWHGVDVAAVALLAPLLGALRRTSRFAGVAIAVGLGAAAVPGLILAGAHLRQPVDAPLSADEVEKVVQRDFAHWLVREQGARPVVLTTPALGDALAYFGGIGVVVSSSPENEAGFSAGVRILSASLRAEAQALVASRELTHLVLPSWDPSLDDLVRLGRQLPAGEPLPGNSLLSWLQRWAPPPWLRPVAYHLPDSPGLESFGFTTFAVVPEQDDALAAARLAGFLVETGQLDLARSARAELAKHPRSLPAQISLAEVNQAIGDTAEFNRGLEAIVPQLGRRAARSLPLDRRISLVAMLLQARQMEAAKQQMMEAVPLVTAASVRDLSTAARVRLLALCGYLRCDLPDPSLRPLILSLLPPALRAQVEAAQRSG